MINRSALLVVALTAVLAFVLVAAPAFAQVDQPRIERPRVNTGPQLQIDPQILQRRPNLQLLGANVEFRAKFDERLLERARDMGLYRLQRSPVTVETMRRLGEEFAIGGETTKAGDLVVATGGPSGFMALDPNTGRLAFNAKLTQQIDGSPGDLPTEGDAAKLAMEFLREHELMPDAKQAVVAHVGRIRSASFDPQSGEESQAMDQALVVHFARQVDEIRVVGPGSKAVVQIGDGGDVIGGGVEWRALGRRQKVSDDGMHGDGEINMAIRRQLGSEFGMAKSIVVDRVGLFYHDQGGFLQPVVGFQAQVTSGEFRYNYFGQVPLMQQPPVQIGPAQISPEVREMLQKGPEELQPETEGPND